MVSALNISCLLRDVTKSDLAAKASPDLSPRVARLIIFFILCMFIIAAYAGVTLLLGHWFRGAV